MPSGISCKEICQTDDFIEASEQDFEDAKTLYVGRADTSDRQTLKV